MLNEPNVLYKKDRYSILSTSQDLSLRDGTMVQLHLVLVDELQEPSRFLRAIANDVAGTFIFNVADLVEDLDLEIRQMPDRDTMGLISLSLRHKYLTAHSLRTAVIENCLKSFRDAPAKPHRTTFITSSSGGGGFISPEHINRRFFTVPGAQA